MSVQLHNLVTRVRARLNVGVLVAAVCHGLVLASVVALVMSCAFVLAGHRVDRRWLWLPCAAGALAWLVLWAIRRVSRHEAAQVADDNFRLDDGLLSALAFERQHRSGAFFSLQEAQTEQAVAEAAPGRLPIRPPWRLVRIAVYCLLGTAVLLCVPDSPGVRVLEAKQAMTEARSAEINDRLAEEMAELERDMSDEERELLERTGLAEHVEALETTQKREEALRQYAAIEKQLNALGREMDSTQDRLVLAQMARELAKAPGTNDLARALAEKRYRDAAEQSRKLKPDDTKPLKERRLENSRLQATARRLAQAGRKPELADNRFVETAQQIEASTCELNEALDAAEAELKELGEPRECEARLGECEGECEGALLRFARDLDDLDTRLKFLARMKSLQACLGQCQSYLSANAQRGGLQWGVGVERSVNETATPGIEGGVLTQLKGQKRGGTSEIAVEEALSGDGVSRARARSRQVAFKRQVESLVRREDIPEAYKRGVRRYFETMHEAPASAGGSDGSGEATMRGE
jgi:hypothetical protein